MEKLVPITRLGKFFGGDDFNLEVEMGKEWLEGDMNFTVILYRVDKYKTKIDDVYGETVKNGVKFLPPIELKGLVKIVPSVETKLGNSKLAQDEPGNMTFSVYQKYLDDLEIDIQYGDYLGYYESENRVRYYDVSNDGRVVSDNKHTYGGYKPFYRTIVATYVSENDFNGL
jgi:hypothetical protein